MRVTNQVQAGESVLVLFAGVGPFVIPSASRGARVVAIEQNPDACRWLVKNLRKNRVSEQVTIIQGDAFDPVLQGEEQFNRAIIPTPYGKDEIFDLAAARVRCNGLLHFYTFKNVAQSKEWEHEFENHGYEVISRRRCGNVAPAVSRWVFDLRRC
jgi:tRNA (guanine37-N1)-methyltransferase